MAQDKLALAQANLRSAVALRYEILALEALADEISLLSINAQVTSSQIGQAGRVFRVMAEEVTAISTCLRKAVQQIRVLTHHWARNIADVTTQTLRLQRLDSARSYEGRKDRISVGLDQARDRFAAVLQAKQEQIPALLHQLLAVVDDMARSLRVVNYVKIGIMVEAENLAGPTQGANQGRGSPFAYLAESLQVAADRIRQIADQALMRLRQFEVAQ